MDATRHVGWVLALALGVAGGCSHPSGEAQPVAAPTAATEPTAAAPTATAPRPGGATARPGRMRHMDPAGALFRAADALALDGAQRATVQGLEQNLEASSRELGSAFHGVHADWAAQIRAGAVDPEKVQADEAVLTDAVQGHVQREVEALDGLHAALNPSQRAAAVSAARSSEPGVAEEQGRPPASAGQPAGLDRLTRELGLDPDQQQRVSALLAAQPDPAAYRAQHEQRFSEVLNAFASERFDAQTTLQAMKPSLREMVHQRVEHEAAFFSQLLPILRPDQRETLASNIEAHGWWGPRQEAH
ncbi:MAG TPA: hypothetical protein VE987_14885 [Polyangiaceae bacterium]|nr:hypothetical protein [Polyangiaceae bacterium]